MALARPVLVMLGMVLLLAMPSTAAAAPCWQGVIADSRDGRVDHEYSIACYRKALDRLPEDVRVYGTAGGDIQRALTSAVTKSAASMQRRSASLPSGSAGGTVARWLVIAAGIGAVVGLVALLSLHSVRARRRH